LTLNEYCEALRGKRIAVIGYGISNKPLVRLLLRYGLDVTVRDKKDCAVEGAKTVCGDGYLANLTEDVIFRTPALMPRTPELAAAVARGATLTSETEAFFEVCPCRIIAITGSDGKTTTSTLIAEMLRREGYTVHLGGNIGTPLLDRADEMKPTDFAVLELSSFQLISMTRSADIAVITNVTPNHLDIHKDFDEYVDAKRNVFAHQGENGIVVLNADDEICRKFAAEARGEVRFFNEQKIDFDIKIPGAHNVLNYKAAITALKDIVSAEAIRATAREFGGVEHRNEFVRELRGVKFYNSSIDSSPTRTTAAIRSYGQKVILIAGGKDKGIAYDSIGLPIVENVKTLVLTGMTADKIRAAVENCADYHGEPQIIFEPEFEAAVKTAAGVAASGDIVVLSPASTSFDRFANFEERGNYYKEIVNGLD
jgi:UDP-N-acetylmuramoylalanine--D-glutamate ligase